MKRKNLLVLFIVVLMILTGCQSAEKKLYNEAIELFEVKNFEQALAIFKELGEYKDSAEKARESAYNIAVTFYKNQEFKRAVPLLEELVDYEDSRLLLLKAKQYSKLDDLIAIVKNNHNNDTFSVEYGSGWGANSRNYSVVFDQSSQNILFEYQKPSGIYESMTIGFDIDKQIIGIKYYYNGLTVKYDGKNPELSATFSTNLSEFNMNSELEVEDFNTNVESYFGDRVKKTRGVQKLAYELLTECEQILYESNCGISLKDIGFNSL